MFPSCFFPFSLFQARFCDYFSFSLVLGFVWGVVGCAWDASVWEGLGAPFGVCGTSLFTLSLKNIFFEMISGDGFGVGLVADTFPVGGIVVQGVGVPGGATFFGAVHVPGGIWGLGVVGSGRKIIGNLSRRMCAVTVEVRRRRGCTVVVCICPIGASLVSHASYITHVCGTQYHVNKDGDHAGGEGDTWQAGGKGRGIESIHIIFYVSFVVTFFARFTHYGRCASRLASRTASCVAVQ